MVKKSISHRHSPLCLHSGREGYNSAAPVKIPVCHCVIKCNNLSCNLCWPNLELSFKTSSNTDVHLVAAQQAGGELWTGYSQQHSRKVETRVVLQAETCKLTKDSIQNPANKTLSVDVWRRSILNCGEINSYLFVFVLIQWFPDRFPMSTCLIWSYMDKREWKQNSSK